MGSRRGCASDRDCSGGYRCSGAVCVPPAFSDEPFSEFQLEMDNNKGLSKGTLKKNWCRNSFRSEIAGKIKQ